ncbi:MAG: glycosyltransferase family 2 protein [Gemmatimonadota bacterium]|nr:MAG: glycosyltransferase family 2 protein [Gemmatimonadota bacterium]
MIYVCVPSFNAASTVGLVLWKIRQVLEEFRREYQVLVVDDASTDDTAAVLEPYERALPMTLIRMGQRVGHGASLEILVREALSRTDRPRRDCLITLPTDFSVTPAVLPDMIKRIESGADVVVGEALTPRISPAMRGVRRLATWLLRPGVQLKGLRDVASGVYAFRLITLRSCIKESRGPLLQTDGRCADAELVARAATVARQIAVLPLTAAAPDGLARPRERALSLALNLIRAGRSLSIPAPQTPIQRAS